MCALDFILSLNVKSLLNIICYLDEKKNLLTSSQFFQVNNFKSKLNDLHLKKNSVSNSVQCVFE